ncbi:hypothetical protein ACFRAE_05050 [Sphingobacterium sp. HJSM2_6]|uniref:hypothetical protein n=1 Tax=Sphingobacterium sp. HJSM2_6 TaxID=3366264 RepID=UPI003BDFD5C1
MENTDNIGIQPIPARQILIEPTKNFYLYSWAKIKLTQIVTGKLWAKQIPDNTNLVFQKK